MSSQRHTHGPRGYPYGAHHPFPSGFDTVAGSGRDNVPYHYGYYPMNTVVQPQYSNTYYANMATHSYPSQMGPQCGPSYGNLAAAQDSSVVCYSCGPHPGNGVQPVAYYPTSYMGVPEYYMYPASNFPTHNFHPQAPPPPPIAAIPPPLDHRRNSCSSAESIATPQTPPLSCTYVESIHSIAADSSHGMPLSPSSDRGIATGFPAIAKDQKFSSQSRLHKNANELPPPPTSAAGRNSLYNPSKTTNVYIRGLAPDTDDDKLLRLIQQYGHVVSHKSIIDKTTGFCKGYGFALYEKMDDAKACVLGVARVNLDAGFARESFNSRLKSLGDPNSTNLYVSNLSPSVDEAKLAEIFKDYQTMSVRILRDAQGISRGVGFVRFANHEICDQVIAQFNDKVAIEGHAEIQVRYADTYAQKTLKEATTRIREYYCNEQKKVIEMGLAAAPPASTAVPKVPTGPRFAANRKWNSVRTGIS